MATQTEQPDEDTKLRTLQGEATGWDYRFDPGNLPSSAHTHWTQHDWITYIGSNWFKRAA